VSIISPSILAADMCHLGKDIALIETGGAEWVHIDVMDGHFVPNLTFGPPLVKDLKGMTDLVLDVHLMVDNPDDTLDWYLNAGADFVTVHVEAVKDLPALIERVHARSARIGLALCPDTPVEVVTPYLDALDMVLIMSVHPGFAGQSFIDSSVEKIARLRTLYHDAGRDDPLIQVDGGINTDTAARCAGAGANVFVAGNAIFKAPNPNAALHQIRNATI
jgi:ribulose-phosphate 3-epimerase